VTAVVRPLVVATVLLLGAGPVAVTGASDPAGGPRLSVAVVAASASARDLPEGMLRDQRTWVAAVDGYWKRQLRRALRQAVTTARWWSAATWGAGARPATCRRATGPTAWPEPRWPARSGDRTLVVRAR